MKSIVLELQQLASEDTFPITSLLRKALIVTTKLNLDDFKKFLSKDAPEILAELLEKVPPENKLIIELDDLSLDYKEKLCHCDNCSLDFWVEISKIHPKCPKCKRAVSKFSPKKNYR